MLAIANILSWSRIAVTPLVMLLLSLWDWSPAYIIAAVLWILAQITDVLDGYFARKQNTVSNLGIFLDLTADKLFVCGVLVILVQEQVISGWLVAVILIREFLITGMRTYAAAEGIVIPAGKSGKLKTVFTAIAVAWLILWADVVMRPNGLLRPLGDIKIGDFAIGRNLFEISWLLMYFVVFLTVYSGWVYMSNAAYLFRSNRPVSPIAPTSKPASPKQEAGVSSKKK
jgi:CDP-diacylglycerol---glycerol-3-phosphate 3-phosphatidyltransferase